MYTPVAQRNSTVAPTTRSTGGYIPVAQRGTQKKKTVNPKIAQYQAEQLAYDEEARKANSFRGLLKNTATGLPDGAKKVGKFVKDLAYPTYGYDPKELAEQPSFLEQSAKEKIQATGRMGASIFSGLGQLGAMGLDKISQKEGKERLIDKLAKTKVGGKLADASQKVADYAMPDTAKEAQAQRFADLASNFIPVGGSAKNVGKGKGLLGKIDAPTTPKTAPETTIRVGTELDSSIGKLEVIAGVPTVGNKSGFGLAKITGDHPDVVPYLSEALDNAKVVEKLPQRTILEGTSGDKTVRIIIDHQLGKEPKTFLNNAYIVPRKGLEPLTSSASTKRSTTELSRQVNTSTISTKSQSDLLSQAKTMSKEEFVKGQIDTKVEKLQSDADTAWKFLHREGKNLTEKKIGIVDDYIFDPRVRKEFGDLLNKVDVAIPKEKFPVDYGNAYVVRNRVDGKIKPTIYINPTKILFNTPEEINQILSHELIHIKQGAKIKSVAGGESAAHEISAYKSTNYYKDIKGLKSQLEAIWEGANKELPKLPTLPKASDQTISETLNIKNIEARKTPTRQGKAELPDRPVSTAKANLLESKSPATYTSKIPETTYEVNRTKLVEKKSKVRQLADSLSDVRKSIGEGTDKLLGTISTRLKNIDPTLKTQMRTFEFKLAQSVQSDRKAIEGFLKKTKDLSIPDYADLDLALKNGDAVKIESIVKKYELGDEFKQVRKTLDDLWDKAQNVGYDIGYEKNYFPRMIKDPEGLLGHLGKGDDWSIIDEAIKAKETDLGRYLTVNEKANVVNSMVRGYGSGKITLSETGAMKARTIDTVDAELNQFYHDSIEALIRYTDSTNDAIEARRFFGKGNKTDQFANIDDSIGSYILDLLAKGKIKPSQEKELRSILQARFAPVGTSGVVRVYKNLSYVDTMGSPISAITQLGDLAFALYKGGPIQTVKAFSRALVGKSKITRADIGIEKIAQEFEDASRSARAVDKVFRLVGLHKLDALGKETVINGSIGKLRKLAKEPSADFIRKLELVFGDDPKTITRVTDDLKAGRTTEDTKLLAFNELLDVQPVALSEMPEQYLKGGNGRIFYMLKTYTIKLFDVYRNEVFHQMKVDKIKGIKNLLYLSGALVTMNATADEIKDFILNRETSLSDRVVDNTLKLAGFSKFTIYKARTEGIGSAVAKTILPPFKFIDSAYKDVTKGQVSETVQSIPVGGKLYYWWFGKGASKTEDKEKKGTGGTKLPDLPELPKLPKLPSI